MSCIKAALFILLVLMSMSHEAVAASELTDAAGPFDRAFCPSPCTRVAPAHRFPGTNAGDKIAAAIAALPSGVGGYVDATGFPDNQSLTGFTIPPGVTVELAPVTFTTTGSLPITINQGGRLIGSGSNNPGQTRLKLGNGLNRNLIELISADGASGWWHHGELRGMRVDGNKANNTLGTCVHVNRIGETSLIQRLMVINCAEDGMMLTGSASGTGSVENVSVFTNGLCGIHIDDYKSGIYLKSVGGDDNVTATLCITNPNTGGGSIYIADFKSERSIAGPAITISGGTTPVTLTLAGGNALQGGGGGTTFLEILNTVTANPIINIIGLWTGNGYTTLIDDQENSIQMTSDAISYHGLLSYTGGKSIRFDKNGFVIVP